MGDFKKYLIIIMGVNFLFYLFGLLNGTATSFLFNLMLNPTLIQEYIPSIPTNPSEILTAGAWTLGIGAALFLTQRAATTLGTTFRADFILFAGIVGVFLSFGYDMITVYQVLAEQNRIIATLIMSPLFLIYIVSVLEWWRGTST